MLPLGNTPPPPSIWVALRRVRTPLVVLAGLLFAALRFIETLALDEVIEGLPAQGALDAVIWGGLAALAFWGLLTWVVRVQERFEKNEQRMVVALQQSKATLELLYEINQRVAASAGLDEILDYASSLPGRLLGAKGSALVLLDRNGEPLTTRRIGFSSAELAATRAMLPLQQPNLLDGPQLLRAPSPDGQLRCLLIPLVESGMPIAPVGWLEAYLGHEVRPPSNRPLLDQAGALAPDTATFLLTVAGELAEAIRGARRRANELDSLATIEQALTRERTRIAHDLHDGVAQSLAFLRMRVGLWEDWLSSEPERLAGEFTTMKETLRFQIEELRRAMFALRPIELAELGFEGAIRRLITDFADQHEWELELHLDAPQTLPHELELAVFRVVQEALTNSAKHAQADQIRVQLNQIDGGLQIVVRDNGRGFEPGQLSDAHAHLGLRQMGERARALDGQLTIIAQPNSGTEVRVWLPIRYSDVRP